MNIILGLYFFSNAHTITVLGLCSLVFTTPHVCALKWKHPGFEDLIMTARASHRVFTTESLSMELNNLLSTSPTVWHYCDFPGPSGKQWGPNEEESPGISFQGLAELTCNE